MPTRRIFIASAIPAALSVPSLSAQSFAEPGGSFADFVSGVRAEARREGIRPATLDRAFAGVVPNQKVLDRDHPSTGVDINPGALLRRRSGRGDRGRRRNRILR
jgi:membrane-bound lytic murein transglycosylase B